MSWGQVGKEIRTASYDIIIPEIFPLLQEFLIYGGYPEVVLTDSFEKKQGVLQDIFDLYLKKDIVEYLSIEKVSGAKMLLQQLSINHGGQANFSEYGTHALLDTKTVQNYTEIFQETFLVLAIKPFFSNKNKEITKMPKIYFLDNGVRNFFLNNFTEMEKRQDSGMLFESFILGEFLKAGALREEIKYYRTKYGIEVDFILDKVSRQIPIEVKYKSRLKTRDILALRKFMDQYSAKSGYIFNLGEIDTTGPIYKKDCFNVEDVLTANA